MRTKLNIKLPKLEDEDDFESLLRDICALEWDDPATEKFGRKGQKQFGVDVYGRPAGFANIYRGVQCKHRITDIQLSQGEIEKEVSDARLFPHKLDRLIIATDGVRDTNTQIIIDQANESEYEKGGFQVSIWFWDDISERLAAYPHLMIRYYKDLYKHISTFPLLERLCEIPIQIIHDPVLNSSNLTRVIHNLEFRGIRILNPIEPSNDRFGPSSELIDGVICSFTAENCNSEASLLPFLSKLINYDNYLVQETPIFILLPPEVQEQFTDIAHKLNLNIGRFSIFISDQSPVDIADNIFKELFSYGYKRRGYPNTFNILARTREAHLSGILLDVNLQSLLSTELFPTTSEWESQIIPALRAINKQIMSRSEVPRIQINSQLPLPAAIALGFYFNIRVSTIGVWARTLSSSDFKKQFWLSDTQVDNIIFEPEWLPFNNEYGDCAILEISSFVPIHQSVQNFVATQDLKVKKWGIVNLVIKDESFGNIEEEMAVAFANSVARIIRQINGQGITDIHLFARIPSALAVLVGQRLVACGRIHLYWFDNPSYRYAFYLA